MRKSEEGKAAATVIAFTDDTKIIPKELREEVVGYPRRDQNVVLIDEKSVVSPEGKRTLATSNGQARCERPLTSAIGI